MCQLCLNGCIRGTFVKKAGMIEIIILVSS